MNVKKSPPPSLWQAQSQALYSFTLFLCLCTLSIFYTRTPIHLIGDNRFPYKSCAPCHVTIDLNFLLADFQWHTSFFSPLRFFCCWTSAACVGLRGSILVHSLVPSADEWTVHCRAEFLRENKKMELGCFHSWWMLFYIYKVC